MNSKKTQIVVIIPTYNEKENIISLLERLIAIGGVLRHAELSIVIVDDNSPDGTGQAVINFREEKKYIYLLTGSKDGLGRAYTRGYEFALRELKPDVVIQMDADFSHTPEYIIKFVDAISRGAEVVIGSRYVPDGSIPSDWPWVRVLVSRWGNVVARRVAGLRGIADCTGGFRAFRSSLLQKIDFKNIAARGYAFQLNMLHAAVMRGAIIKEVPIKFCDRKSGKSKMGFSDIAEFIINSFRLRLVSLGLKNSRRIVFVLVGVMSIGSVYLLANFFQFDFSLRGLGLFLFAVISLLITVQSLFTLVGMVYAWEQPKRVEANKSPDTYLPPDFSFTALIPALHEPEVIGQTISSVAAIDYPDSMKEIFVICREDDEVTISAARETIKKIGNKNIRLLIPNFRPRNKPDKLNFALQFATKSVVCVFDAEDNPHKDIYKIVNTVMRRDGADVVQSGVQLMNYRSNWFSTLNVLEYFFWFKSVLHYFAKRMVVPLGGNTVFFRRSAINLVGGWDANCLTEDADMGISLSISGANVRIIYDEAHATQEETPPSLESFIKQRTRWNQGFIQVYKKGEWRRLPRFSQRLFVGYLLLWPELQSLLFIYIAISLVMMFTVKLPIVLTLFSLTPFYILALHLLIMNVGLYEFIKHYKLKFSWWMPFKVTVTFIPFQIVLGISALRAVYREIRHKTAWEKTEHVNAHRIERRQTSVPTFTAS